MKTSINVSVHEPRVSSARVLADTDTTVVKLAEEDSLARVDLYLQSDGASHPARFVADMVAAIAAERPGFYELVIGTLRADQVASR
ncbi:hypothetical protein SEA_RYADEL_117 [Mycobacterium phage Ryadel]|uniref:Uncharacterized protein n=1 Tax=Mycobacterium phage Ryadel TaxID=2283292 RepID=A0A345MF83_9CAUD|nr:hypothetical protein KNU03_gp117 [Mycobacterium phage Ryadel]AXH69214.1 hypothetical protein SEA_RYADEL_117 [Mycobacterium phage Ryadel]